METTPQINLQNKKINKNTKEELLKILNKKHSIHQIFIKEDQKRTEE